MTIYFDGGFDGEKMYRWYNILALYIKLRNGQWRASKNFKSGDRSKGIQDFERKVH
jgi:hypothetical protein